MIHQRGQPISIAFNDINERSGSFVFDSSEQNRLPLEANLIGAVCVRFAFSDHRLQIWPELTDSLRSAPQMATDSLIARHQTVVTPLQVAPLAAGLADFETRALQASCQRLNRDNRHVLGGLAIYESSAGYKSELFFNWLLPQEFNNQALNSRLECNEYPKNYHVVPAWLKAMTSELPVGNDYRLDTTVHQAVKTVIARGLPEARALSNELSRLSPPLLLPRPLESVAWAA